MKDTAALRGVYDAERAAALSGVPKSTIYQWARQGLVVPSISPEKLKLWSWLDLVELRALHWLRHPPVAGSAPVPAASMKRVKAMLHEVRTAALSLGEQLAEQAIKLRLDHSGRPFVVSRSGVSAFTPGAQAAAAMQIDLLDEFRTSDGVGPDLRRPAPGLRIIPGALSGEPHIDGTRIETRVLWSLRKRGFSEMQITTMFPGVSLQLVKQAVKFEGALSSAAKAA